MDNIFIEVNALQRWITMFHAMLVPFGASEVGYFREVAALYSGHLRQVSLYHLQNCP